jgi:hypothetical protein
MFKKFSQFATLDPKCFIIRILLIIQVACAAINGNMRSAADYCSVSQTITCRSRKYHLRVKVVVKGARSGASVPGFVKGLTISARLIDNPGYVSYIGVSIAILDARCPKFCWKPF